MDCWSPDAPASSWQLCQCRELHRTRTGGQGLGTCDRAQPEGALNGCGCAGKAGNAAGAGLELAAREKGQHLWSGVGAGCCDGGAVMRAAEAMQGRKPSAYAQPSLLQEASPSPSSHPTSWSHQACATAPAPCQTGPSPRLDGGKGAQVCESNAARTWQACNAGKHPAPPPHGRCAHHPRGRCP